MRRLSTSLVLALLVVSMGCFRAHRDSVQPAVQPAVAYDCPVPGGDGAGSCGGGTALSEASSDSAQSVAQPAFTCDCPVPGGGGSGGGCGGGMNPCECPCHQQ